MIPGSLSHYEVVAPIGEGGMGIVYRAVDTRLGRPVALKVLRPEKLISEESRKRFVHEARAASALNHPHIVTIYDIGQDGGVDFIAMELLSGESLARLIERRLGLADALAYAVQIADAVACAHAVGVLHRDLKPANIMVTDKGSIKVVDFGLAKLTEVRTFATMDERVATEGVQAPASLQTEDGRLLGTAPYMSPEQVEGKPADPRSDVFSFGAVLYEMATGRRAFCGATRISTLAAVLNGEPLPPRDAVPGLPTELERLILRCLRKSPERRWQSMADLKVALEDLRDEAASRSRASSVASAPPRPWVRIVVAGAAVAAVVASVAVARRTTGRRPRNDSRPFLTRLTSDVGWTDYPAISPDGRMLAYASDRGGDGNLDIWVQQVPDGTPVRLTRHPADDIEPSFSADGSRIAFQSGRQGGGVYVVQTLGGEERLLAAGGFSPRFSPDGSWIAYGVAGEGGGRLCVAPAAGGPPMPLASDFYRTQAHLWSPDGKFLLFWGQHSRDAPPDGNVDWYVAAVPGGSARPTGARRLLLKEGFQAFAGLPLPDAWVGAGNRILFHGSVGDSSNMWQVALSPQTWQVGAPPQRVTSGTTDEAAASVTLDGRMVFVSRTMRSDIWTLPIDADQGRVEGALERVTQDAADDYDPTLSDDGATLVFRSRRAGRFAVVLRRLGGAAETVLTRVPEDHFPAVSRDGTRVAYSFQQNGKLPIFLVAANGGTPEQACDDCGEVKEWSPGGDQILYVTAHDPSSVGRLKIGSSHDDLWLRHPVSGVFSPRVSSDGRWIAFNIRRDRLARARVMVAEVRGTAVADQRDWIVIGDDGEGPTWSPQAHFLYFWSDRDGSPCLWAQRLDATSKRPIGPPLSIQHFHNRGLSWRNLYLGAPGIAVARGRIVFNLGEHTGNIWMMNLASAAGD